MTRNRIILAAIAIILVVVIYLLPRVVVENNKEDMQTAGDVPMDSLSSKAVEKAHSTELSEEKLQTIKSLKQELSLANNPEKSVIFADSLAGLYLDNNQYDSAAKFVEIIAKNSPGTESWKKAGDVYYDAFTYAIDQEKRQHLAEKTREYYDKVLEEEPTDLYVKNRVAMTLLSSGNPMSGIMMLREIIQDDPDNEQALFNLGVLSMQSGQFDKAVERFENLRKVNPDNLQGQFFLGVSYLKTGKKNKARKQFEWVKERDSDPEVQAAADNYLEDL